MEKAVGELLVMCEYAMSLVFVATPRNFDRGYYDRLPGYRPVRPKLFESPHFPSRQGLSWGISHFENRAYAERKQRGRTYVRRR